MKGLKQESAAETLAATSGKQAPPRTTVLRIQEGKSELSGRDLRWFSWHCCYSEKTLRLCWTWSRTIPESPLMKYQKLLALNFFCTKFHPSRTSWCCRSDVSDGYYMIWRMLKRGTGQRGVRRTCWKNFGAGRLKSTKEGHHQWWWNQGQPTWPREKAAVFCMDVSSWISNHKIQENKHRETNGGHIF